MLKTRFRLLSSRFCSVLNTPWYHPADNHCSRSTRPARRVAAWHMRMTTQLLVLCIATAAHRLSLGPRLRPAVRLPPPACVLETEPLDEQALGNLVEQWQRADEEKLMGSVASTQPTESSVRERAGSAASAVDENSHVGGPESARLTRARQRLAWIVKDADGSVAPDDMFPSLGYSPAAAAERFRGQWSSVGLRQLRLVGPIARFIAKVVLDVQAGVEEERRAQRAAELTAVISGLGPAVIKAGQALSSRSDLLPAEYLLELQRLQDRPPPEPEPEPEPLARTLALALTLNLTLNPTPTPNPNPNP